MKLLEAIAKELGNEGNPVNLEQAKRVIEEVIRPRLWGFLCDTYCSGNTTEICCRAGSNEFCDTFERGKLGL